MTVGTETNQAPETLRGQLIDQLKAQGHIRSAAVEEAMRHVQREVFAPEADIATVYANNSIDILNSAGDRISIMSQPGVVAAELEQATIEPGLRVMEIGAGTGVNAAYLAQLVGPSGHVTTIDIHPELVDRASRALMATGTDNVTTVLRDGDDGAPEFAPFDRILATVGVWDISPAWIDQLADGGLLIVPLRIRGYTQRVTVFQRQGDTLVSLRHELSVFMPMEGTGGYGRHSLTLGPHRAVTLDLHTEQQPASTTADALHRDHIVEWTTVTFGEAQPFDGMALWLSCHLDGWCQARVSRDTAATSIVPDVARPGRMAFYTDDSIGLLVFRRQDNGLHAVGVEVHGLDPQTVARRVAALITEWDRCYRDRVPVITVHALGAPATGQFTLDRPRTHLTIDW